MRRRFPDHASNLARIQLDGKAVIVRSTLPKERGADALPMCEAAYAAAKTAQVEFQSVTVRSSGDVSIASRNELRGETSCTVV